MNLKGKQTYQATSQQVWDILMDREKLAKITPGVSKLELTGDSQYNAISEIKIGPVKGAFEGDLFLLNKVEPSTFTLQVKQLSKIGNADATVNIQINDLDDGQCELTFDGKAKLSGTLARTGQRVLSGVASTLTKQFFTALEEEINSKTPLVEVLAPTPGTTTSALSPEETPKSFNLWTWIKSLFGIK